MASPVDSLIVAIRCGGNYPVGLIGKTKYNITALTAANIVTQKSASTTLATAEGVLSTGILASSDISLNLSKVGGYPAVTANRGNKWIISSTNPDGRVFTYTIPAAADAGNVESDGVTALLTSAAWSTFKGAFDVLAVDPNNATLTLNSAKLGGRRR